MGMINNSSAVKAGTLAYFGASTAPAGYVKANGAAVSRTLYAGLFNAIGTTFGAGDGSTTFNLPDMRGEFVRGFDDSRGVDSGRLIGTQQGDQFRSHNHGDTFQIYWENGSRFASNSTWGFDYSHQTGYSGGNETRPRNVAWLACIKY